MSETVRGACFEEEDRRAYAMGALAPDAVAALEVHMAGCAGCAAAVGRMMYEAAEARRWNAAQHGRAWRHERLGLRLAAALAAASGELRSALSEWAVRGAAAAAAGMARAIPAPTGLQWEGQPLAAVGGAPPVADITRGGGIRTSGAVRVRGSVPSEPPTSVVIDLADGSQAMLNREGDSLTVRFPGRSRENPPPPILVAPATETEAPQAALAEWDQLQHWWVATLPLPQGEFEVAIGPVATAA
jgi:hypothetical protein